MTLPARRSIMGLAAAVVPAFALAISAPGAPAAGTYDVLSCDAAGGPNRAWKPQVGNPALFVSQQRCPALGSWDGFGVRSTTLAVGAGQLSGSWWRFDPPAGTRLEAIEWAGRYATAAPGWVARIESSRGTVAGCGPSTRRCERRWARGSRPARYELNGASWIRVGTACLAATGCRTGDGRTTPFADASTWYSRLVVRDPAAPTVTLGGRSLEREWVTPGTELTAAATDASGIARIHFTTDGEQLDTLRFDCDRTLPRPCVDRTATFRLPRGLPDGRTNFTVSALDAAGNEAQREVPIGVDGSAPAATDAPAVDGGDRWRPSPRFVVRWDLPDQGSGAPIASSVLSICRKGLTRERGGCLPEQVVVGADPVATVELPSEGEWEASVLLVDAAGNSDPREGSPPAILRWDATPPGAGRVVVPQRWLGRDAARALVARLEMDDGLPISGLSGWAVARDGDPGVAVELEGPSPEVRLGDFPEGVTEISARAISSTGVPSRGVARAKVRIDETPPDLAFEGLGEKPWSGAPVRVVARGRDQASLSGMDAADGDGAEVRIALDGMQAEVVPGDEASLDVVEDGVHRVVAEAVDAAGNSSGRRELTVRVDATPPDRLSFLPQDAADPRLVRVDALDVTSGVESVSVRVRPVSGGEWVPLPGSLDGERFEAVIDESRLREGLWEMEATAFDVAGNRRVATRTISGDPALVAIPLRSRTRVDASFARTASGGGPGATTIAVAHGSGAEISGRLLDSLEQPLSGALLTMSAAPAMVPPTWSAAGHALTDRLGRFSFRLPPGPSRRLRIAFAGDHSGLPSSLDLQVRVPAVSSLRVRPGVVRAGTVATFSGRLGGGWIPAGGKMVMVQALIPRNGWQTFAVARSNGSGEWSTRYRFRTAVGRSGHQIRAVVPTEAGYPFAGFTSRPLRVRGAG